MSQALGVALRESRATSREGDPGLNQSSSESYRGADKRDDKFIAHTEGFQLMKIMDVENDALTNAKQQGHTNPSRLKTN